MVPTPLQSMLGLDVLPRRYAHRRRKRAGAGRPAGRLRRAPAQARGDRDDVPAAVGQRSDRRRLALHPEPRWSAQKVAVAAFVLFLFGVIRLVLELVDAMTRRGKVHFSTISKDLLTLTLWFVVVMVVLYTDFGVQPLSILTPTVFAAVLGFALQETLGNIFSGLSLSMGRPFEPGDWIRSGTHVGQRQGNRMACDDDRDARQRTARNSQLRDRQGPAVQLRDRPRARRNHQSGSATACRPITCARSCSPCCATCRTCCAIRRPKFWPGELWRFRDPLSDQVLDRRLRRAGTRARSRRVEPLVCAAPPFDRDSVPDPHRPCARRGPRRRR